MWRKALVAALVVLFVAAGGGLAVAGGTPRLSATAPASVSGTEASSVFEIGDHVIREIRYDDRGTLVYTFRIRNDGRLPVTVLGLAPDQPPARLFLPSGLEPVAGSGRLGAGESAAFRLSLRMDGCETLSARAGSFVTEVALRTRQAGVFGDSVVVTLPEEIHTGSPREAFCPDSTATSRSPG